jgi:hypothetical protein
MREYMVAEGIDLEILTNLHVVSPFTHPPEWKKVVFGMSSVYMHIRVAGD